MSLSTQPYKGARDFYPEDMRLMQYIFKTWRSVCESFGYEEYDAPILEPTDLYLSKGSQEIVEQQTYTFKDRGDRSVTLRTEMTPSVSRMVAGKRQELSYPLRWYSIPQCWRYERTQRGRGREFYQLNVDLFGVEGISADLEMIQIADALMKAFKAKPEMYQIRINSRKAMEELLVKNGFVKEISPKIISLMDKLEKPDFAKYLASFDGLTQKKINEFVDKTKGDQILETPAGKQLAELLAKLKTLGIQAMPDIGINRGFDYYTDIVFEVFDTNPENNRSMFGGGRYDGLVELFGAEAVPTVGFGMGDITLRNFLETHGLVPKLETATDVYAVLIGDVLLQAQEPLAKLREQGINVAVDSTGRKIDRQLKNATKKGINYAVFIGEKELTSGRYELKNLETGKNQALGVDDIVNELKVGRNV